MEQIKVYNCFNAPRGKKVASGEEIYEWEYLDENGELKKDKKNVKEEINSFVSRVDYKSQIKRGELDLDANITGNVERDFTGIPNNTVDIINYLRYLSTLDKEQVAYLLEQLNGGNEETVQEEQARDIESSSGNEDSEAAS